MLSVYDRRVFGGAPQVSGYYGFAFANPWAGTEGLPWSGSAEYRLDGFLNPPRSTTPPVSSSAKSPTSPDLMPVGPTTASQDRFVGWYLGRWDDRITTDHLSPAAAGEGVNWGFPNGVAETGWTNKCCGGDYLKHHRCLYDMPFRFGTYMEKDVPYGLGQKQPAGDTDALTSTVTPM